MSLILRAENPCQQIILPMVGKKFMSLLKLGLAKSGIMVLIETRTLFSIMYTVLIRQLPLTIPLSCKQGYPHVEKHIIFNVSILEKKVCISYKCKEMQLCVLKLCKIFWKGGLWGLLKNFILNGPSSDITFYRCLKINKLGETREKRC